MPPSKLIEQIANRMSKKIYWQNYRRLREQCNIEDFKQEIYLKIWKGGLWDSTDAILINITARRACIDLLRHMLWGYQNQKFKYYEITDGDERSKKKNYKVFNSRYFEIISLYKLAQSLNSTEKIIIDNIINGFDQINRLKISEGRVSQIKKDIIKKFKKIIDKDEITLRKIRIQ